MHVYTLMFVEIAVLWRTLRKNNEIKQVNLHNQEIKFTLVTLKTGHLEEDCPFTKFSENKRFSSFFLQTDQ